jgi:hypothetical protein
VDLFERADRAIAEARALHETHRFILWWLLMRPALNARHTSLLLDELDDPVQHTAVRSNDADLAALARLAMTMWLAQVDPVHSA